MISPLIGVMRILGAPKVKEDSDLRERDEIETGAGQVRQEYPGTVKVSAAEVVSLERSKFIEPGNPPPAAAGNPDAFMPRQQFLLVDQYLSEKGIVSTVGNVIHQILYKIEDEGSLSIIDIKTATDLDLLSKGKTIASEMDRTSTKIGSAFHQMTITRPSPDVKRALNRQQVIRYLIANPQTAEALQGILEKMAEGEIALLSCWDGKCQLPGSAGGLYYNLHPQINRIFNNNSFMLDVSAIWTTTKKATTTAMMGVSGALLTVYAGTEMYRSVTDVDSPQILENYADRYITSTSLGPLGGILMTPNVSMLNASVAAVGGITSLLSLQNSFAWLKADTSVVFLLRTILSKVATYYRSMKEVHELCRQNPSIVSKLEHFQKLDDFICNRRNIPELQQIFSLLDSSTFNKDNDFLFRPGEVLLAWELLHSGGGKKKKGENKGAGGAPLAGDLIRGAFETALPAIAEIDVLFSAARLMKETKSNKAKYCFPEICQYADQPMLHVEGGWNPMISPEAAVPNTLRLGGSSPSKNAIITGPNAGGKSSFGKTIGLIAALIPYGIVPAKKVDGVVFSCLRTSMNISDSIEDGQSLFAAQSKLIADTERQIESLPPGVHSLVVLDEAFIQTNSRDAAGLLLGTLRKIGRIEGNICLGITHFKEVARQVGDEDNSPYKNYKMEGNGTYQLEEGISTDQESNALEIAFRAGISEEIIALAKDRK